MNSDQLNGLLAIGDALWEVGTEHERKTAMMLFQCGCNMQSADAYLRLHKAKKETGFKNKKYPNTAAQDLLEAVKLNHVGAIVLAIKERLFVDPVIQLIFLKVAEKISAKDNSPEQTEVQALIETTVDRVPVFMQNFILEFIRSWEGGRIVLPQPPLCAACRHSKRWESNSPECAVDWSHIENLIMECKYYSRISFDAADCDDDEVKYTMNEVYKGFGDDAW
jgi:hypothetical protein